MAFRLLPPDKRTYLATALAFAHLLLVLSTGTFRWEHGAANALVLGLGWTTAGARRLLGGFLPIWLAGAVMDNQRFLLPLRGEVHTGDLWALEAQLFPASGGFAHWPEYFAQNTHVFFDFLCGLAYFTYLFWFVGFLLYFFVKKSPKFDRLAWAFLAINLLGVVGYLTYPAAPPWYILDYGMGAADLAAKGSPAGTARFDALFGISYFSGFYGRNPNPFGAMPSLHVGYTVLSIWYAWDKGWVWRGVTLGYTALMVFSAAYLTHHYFLDAVAGVAVGLAACALTDVVMARAQLSASESTLSEGSSRA